MTRWYISPWYDSPYFNRICVAPSTINESNVSFIYRFTNVIYKIMTESKKTDTTIREVFFGRTMLFFFGAVVSDFDRPSWRDIVTITTSKLIILITIIYWTRLEKAWKNRDNSFVFGLRQCEKNNWAVYWVFICTATVIFNALKEYLHNHTDTHTHT